MNRRHLIAAAPAVVVAGAVPAVAAETKIEAMFREWRRLFAIEADAFDASATGDDADTKAATKSLMKAEMAMMEMPSQNSHDWMLKMIAVSCFGVFPVEHEDHPIWSEARALVGA